MGLLKKKSSAAGNAWNVSLPLICKRVDLVSLDDAFRKGFTVPEGVRALLFTKEGRHLDQLLPGEYGKGGAALPPGVETGKPFTVLLSADSPFEWSFTVDPVLCADGIGGRLSVLFVLRCTSPGKLFSRLVENPGWTIGDLENAASCGVSAALESAARGRAAAELRDAGDLLRTLVRYAVIDKASPLLDGLGIELVSVRSARFSSADLDRADEQRGRAKLGARQDEALIRRVEARNRLLKILGEKKQASYDLRKKDLELVAQAEKEKILREGELDALKRMCEAKAEDRESEIRRTRERLELEHRLDLQGMKAQFALDVRRKRLSLDREHVEKLLEAGSGRGGGIAAVMLAGLRQLGLPVTDLSPSAAAALSGGELPAGILFGAPGSCKEDEGIPARVYLGMDNRLIAGRRCLLRFRLENLSNRAFRLRIDPELAGLTLTPEGKQSWSQSCCEIPALSVKPHQAVPASFSFSPGRPGLYCAGETSLELIEESGKRMFYRIPPGAFTLNVGTGEGKSIIVNADVMAGDVRAERDSGAVEVGGAWIPLQLEEAPPLPGFGLPERLDISGAGEMRRVGRARLSWYSEKDDRGIPRRRFVFGGDSLEMGRKAALLVRDPKDPDRYETNGCISRIHARISVSRDGRSATLVDPGSTNGTYVIEDDPEKGTERSVELLRGDRRFLKDIERFRLARRKSSFSVLFECRVFRKTLRRGRITALRLRRRDRRDHEYVLVPRRAFIGSGRGAAIRIDSGGVQAFAAVLEWRGKGFVIGPASKDAAISVNGESVSFGKGVPLAPGAEIRIGGVRMTFEEAADGHFKEPCED